MLNKYKIELYVQVEENEKNVDVKQILRQVISETELQIEKIEIAPNVTLQELLSGYPKGMVVSISTPIFDREGTVSDILQNEQEWLLECIVESWDVTKENKLQICI